jgi:glycosyltransferase involved in cell wall biosynthesis
MNKILVIVPIWNKEDFLKTAIEGILQQTYSNFDLILIDDCSTDRSLEIARSYEYLDNVTVLENTENRGCYYTRNKGLNYFKDKEWDYFTIHDADDVSDLTRFQHFIDKFSTNPNLVYLKSTSIEYNFKNNQPTIKEDGNYSTFTGEGTAFISRKVFDTIGYFDDTRFSGDTDYLWRVEALCNTSKSKWKVGELKDILYINYSHENNITKLYNWHTDRPNYWAKVQNEIKKQMIPNNNFYRKQTQ